MSIVNRIKGFVRTVTGAPPLTIADCASTDNVIDYKISGNSVRDGNPTPDAPVEVQSVGDLVTEGEQAGKYKIPVIVTCGDKTETIDIYLDEPLRKLGGHADYIDFDSKKIVRNIIRQDFKGLSWRKGSYTFNYAETTKQKTGTSVLSNVLPTASVTTSQGQGINIANTNTIRVRWDDMFPTLTDWTNYIKNNESYIVYVRNSSIEEEIDLPQLLQFKGTTTYKFGTVVQPSNMEVTYYSTVKE